MRFNDIIKTSNQIDFLKEAYTGQFTIGFELEGICIWKRGADFYLPPYGGYLHGSRMPSGEAEKLKELLDNMFNIEGSSGESKIEKDGSLDIDGFEECADAWNFEYATNKIPFNAKNLEKIYKSLGELEDNGIFTNNSCGFHIHMSFPEIDKKEVAWIICCLSIDEELLQDMLKLDTEYGTIHLFNIKTNSDNEEVGGYARYHYLLDIGNALEEQDYKKVSELLDNDKYKVLHIHSDNGTIEWRGPRGFLNYGDDSVIKSFILKWFRLISKIAKISQSTSYTSNNITLNKNELLKNLSLDYFSLNSQVEKSKKQKRKKLFDMVEEAPAKIFSLGTKAIETIYMYKRYDFIKIIYNLLYQDMFQDDWIHLKDDVFNKLNNLYSLYFLDRPEEALFFLTTLYYPFKSENVSLLDKLTQENKNMACYLMTKVLLGNSEEKYLSDEFVELAEDLNLFNTEIFKKELEMHVKKNGVVSFEKILDITTLLPAYMWNILLKDNYMHYISKIENVPEKFQLRMIKKNPYNIQYINNPTDNVIKIVGEKVPNVKDFIRGE